MTEAPQEQPATEATAQPTDPNQVVLKVTDPFWVQAFHFIREGEETIDITPGGNSVPANLADEIIADAATHDVTIDKQEQPTPTEAPA